MISNGVEYGSPKSDPQLLCVNKMNGLELCRMISDHKTRQYPESLLILLGAQVVRTDGLICERTAHVRVLRWFWNRKPLVLE